MATIPRKGKPFVFITWLTGVLAGDRQCLYAPWVKSHFKYDKLKDDFDLEAWGADHNKLVGVRQREFEADGAKVRVENQNWMRVVGESALLVGKPDLIAERGAQFTVADGKSGDPSKRDWWQMLLYLYMLPKAWKNPSLRVTGELFYASGSRVEVHPQEFTPDRRKEAFGLIRMLGAGTPEPPTTPSIPECKRCDIAGCLARIKDDDDQTPITAEF